jgi:VIT1/CCC1 family predicted Fe2+/Mn2+ transporter
MPYMLVRDIGAALWASIAFTLVALAVFGGVKGQLTGGRALRSALQTTVIGGIAAAVAFAIARAVSG